MKNAIVVSHDFDGHWPFAADYAHDVWRRIEEVHFIRLPHGDRRRVDELSLPSEITRLLCLGVPITSECISKLPCLQELAVSDVLRIDSRLREILQERGISLYTHATEGYWGQSVSEFALGLTLCGLRRIPQLSRGICSSHAPWDYTPSRVGPAQGRRGIQFGDDARFTCGTLQGKRVRIVGIGNIGARYAWFCHCLGANVSAWDPLASEPCFHRSGAKRVARMKELAQDAEVFAPMLPLTDSTRGIVDAAIVDRLPRGTLVVCVTRMQICDCQALRRRVLNDELALAADVFDVEPLPFDDPLLGRHNVIHTPHSAGRTIDANHSFVRALMEQFAGAEESGARLNS